MKKISFFGLNTMFFWLSFSLNAYLILPAPTQTEEIAIQEHAIIDVAHYPSIITLSNLPTKVDNLSVGILFSTGTLPTPYLDVILEGPQGQVSYLLSDVGNNVGVTNYLCFISDEAPIAFPTLPNTDLPLTSFFAFFKPTDGNQVTDTFPLPAPIGPYPASLEEFKNINPNGEWKLYASWPDINVQGTVSPITIHAWQLILNLHPLNDYTGDRITDYVFKKGKNIFVVSETNTLPFTNSFAITKTTTPTAQVKGKIVCGADFSGDYISDLMIKKGKWIRVLKGPEFTLPTHALKVKDLKPVASGDYNGDLVPDVYFQKKRSLWVAINTGTGFEPPTLVANKSLPKKFKIFGALSGRSQPVVMAQNKTTIASLESPTFSTPVTVSQTSNRKIKAGAIGQFIFGLDIYGSTILYRQKKALSFTSPFISQGTFTPLQNNTRKGLKLVAPR